MAGWKRRKLTGVSGNPNDKKVQVQVSDTDGHILSDEELDAKKDEMQNSHTMAVVLPADLYAYLKKLQAVYGCSASEVLRRLLKENKVKQSAETERRFEFKKEDEKQREGHVDTEDKGAKLADAFGRSLVWSGLGINPNDPSLNLNPAKVKPHRMWNES